MRAGKKGGSPNVGARKDWRRVSMRTGRKGGSPIRGRGRTGGGSFSREGKKGGSPNLGARSDGGVCRVLAGKVKSPRGNYQGCVKFLRGN